MRTEPTTALTATTKETRKTPMTNTATRQPGVGDFDFLIGTWEVANRRLREPLSGRTDWDEFPASVTCHGALFDGAANLDEIRFPTKSFCGLTLRLFEPETQQWTLNWVNSANGQLTPPMIGRFGPDGRGEFSGPDTHNGDAIQCRFVWSDISATTARWEQAFSADEGRTWETNWTMRFRRVGAVPASA
jgi:hypothetical protein